MNTSKPLTSLELQAQSDFFWKIAYDFSEEPEKATSLIISRSNTLRFQRRAFWNYICSYSERTANRQNILGSWSYYLDYFTYLLFIHEALKTQTLGEIFWEPSIVKYWECVARENQNV